MKVIFGHFSNRASYASSMFGSLAREAGHDVAYRYCRDGVTEDEIAESLEAFGPAVLGLSMKTFERRDALRIAHVAGSLGIKVITGAHSVSTWPERRTA